MPTRSNLWVVLDKFPLCYRPAHDQLFLSSDKTSSQQNLQKYIFSFHLLLPNKTCITQFLKQLIKNIIFLPYVVSIGYWILLNILSSNFIYHLVIVVKRCGKSAMMSYSWLAMLLMLLWGTPFTLPKYKKPWSTLEFVPGRNNQGSTAFANH